MAIYVYLMGSVGKKVKSKTLLVVTPEKSERVEGYDIEIWCDKGGYLHAKYFNPIWKKPYNSSKDEYYCKYKVKFY